MTVFKGLLAIVILLVRVVGRCQCSRGGGGCALTPTLPGTLSASGTTVIVVTGFVTVVVTQPVVDWNYILRSVNIEIENGRRVHYCAWGASCQLPSARGVGSAHRDRLGSVVGFGRASLWRLIKRFLVRFQHWLNRHGRCRGSCCRSCCCCRACS